MARYWIIVLIVLAVLGGIVFFVVQAPTNIVLSPTPAPQVQQDTRGESVPQEQESPYATLDTNMIEERDPRYDFRTEIPKTWVAEAITSIQAINLYDPNAEGTTSLEQSQIFIRQFSANTFLTLQTVTIHERRELTIVGRPAVRYDIEKKAGVTPFANQPTWRSQRHIVTDVRVSDGNPSVFLVIAKRPDLDDALYTHLLDTLSLTQ